MAGHSKWANIQHRKGAQDKKRGKLFTKLIREITVSARMGGADPAGNPRLRAAIDKGLAGNMNKDTIEKAIKRGVGAQEGEDYEEIRYEGYGVNGVAVLVDCLTDNRNRTVAEVRHAFSKMGGNLGTDGSVAFLFTKIGMLSYQTGCDEDKIMEAALEAGAEDILNNDDGSVDVITTPENYLAVKELMSTAELEPAHSEVTMNASTTTNLDLDSAQNILKLVDMLEDLDDVQSVYTNANIPDDVLVQLA